MTSKRMLSLGMSMRGLGYHPAAWRHPDVPANGAIRLDHFVRTAQEAERGKFDMVFFADGLAIRGKDEPRGSLARYGREIIELEPTTLLAALATHTRRIGLVATASTTYNEPFHIARRFASLDLISNGRAGWNVVTSWSEAEAQNFNRDKHDDYGARYARAAEFVEVVAHLWDSWEPGAFLFDKKSGLFYDESKLHQIDHKGEHFAVRGPLTVAEMPQGRPIIVQAGASEQGRELAAATADVIFSADDTIQGARDYYTDVKSRLAKYGRDAADLKILPAMCPIVAATREEARAKYDFVQRLLDPLVGQRSLYSLFGDISDLHVDSPVPFDRLRPQELVSIWTRNIERARAENMSIRQFYEMLTGSFGVTVIGTGADVADLMEEWLLAEACDGFNVAPSILPAGCEDFVAFVVPELQRRGIYRTEYAHETLRGNLGLKPHLNRYVATR